jgi:hypothetical protein
MVSWCQSNGLWYIGNCLLIPRVTAVHCEVYPHELEGKALKRGGISNII